MAFIDPLIWQDEVRDPANAFTVTDGPNNTKIIDRAGQQIQPGTQQSAEHFNHLENLGYEALQMSVINAQELRQHQRDLEKVHEDLEDLNDEILGEVKSVTLTNSLTYPFNDSKTTVAITTRKSTDYRVIVELQGAPANVGEIYITDRTVNTFKVQYTGSAPSITVKCYISGGASIYG